MKILILEDHLEVSKKIIRTLQPANEKYVLHHYVTIESGLDHIKKHHYDVMVLDVYLLDGNGVDFAEAVRQNSKNRESHLIFLLI